MGPEMTRREVFLSLIGVGVAASLPLPIGVAELVDTPTKFKVTERLVHGFTDYRAFIGDIVVMDDGVICPMLSKFNNPLGVVVGYAPDDNVIVDTGEGEISVGHG